MRLPPAALLAVAATVFALALSPAAGRAQDQDAARYAECMRLAETRPTAAWEEAGQWRGVGGGEPAKHCAAVALIGIGEYQEAAHRLEELATASRAPDPVRAGMLAQAAQAWLLAGDAERAHAAQTTALELAPGDPALLLDRAVTLATAENYRAAIDDLTAALTAAPGSVDALALRATAFRYVDEPDLAARDVTRALEIDAAHAAALVEKGVQARLAGDLDTARRAWLAAIDAAPNSAEAETARLNIQTLDGGG